MHYNSSVKIVRLTTKLMFTFTFTFTFTSVTCGPRRRFVKRNPMVSGVATLLSVLTDANLESFLSHSDVASFLGLHRAPLTLPTDF